MNRSFFHWIGAFVLLTALLTGRPTHAQPGLSTDTLALTLPQAEAQFLQKNLTLLAERYNITAAEAQVQQARLWDNPTLYVEQNVYRPATGELPSAVLPTGRDGENIVTVQQLIRLAGKRRAQVEVARTGVQAEQFAFQELLRTLRYQLRTAFYQLYFDQRALHLYDREIASTQTTVDRYQEQYQKGNVALKEVIRLRAFVIQLQNERQQIRSNEADQQTTLHTLLSDASGRPLRPVADITTLRTRALPNLTVQQLLDSARLNRPDLLLRTVLQTQADQSLTLQRKLAVPDLTLGYTYDKQGSYIRNYHALSVGIPLPVFNRNQGGIKAAQAQLQASEQLAAQQQATVAAEVQQAYAKALDADRLLRATDPNFSNDFDRLLSGISESYARRNLSLVEYLDFLEAYKNNVLQKNELQRNRADALEQLNYVTGSNLVR